LSSLKSVFTHSLSAFSLARSRQTATRPSSPEHEDILLLMVCSRVLTCFCISAPSPWLPIASLYLVRAQRYYTKESSFRGKKIVS
jgi:hypothetical protein